MHDTVTVKGQPNVFRDEEQ